MHDIKRLNFLCAIWIYLFRMRGIINILKKLKVNIKKGAYQKALVRAHLCHKQEPDPGPALDLGAHI